MENYNEEKLNKCAKEVFNVLMGKGLNNFDAVNLFTIILAECFARGIKPGHEEKGFKDMIESLKNCIEYCKEAIKQQKEAEESK